MRIFTFFLFLSTFLFPLSFCNADNSTNKSESKIYIQGGVMMQNKETKPLVNEDIYLITKPLKEIFDQNDDFYIKTGMGPTFIADAKQLSKENPAVFLYKAFGFYEHDMGNKKAIEELARYGMEIPSKSVLREPMYGNTYPMLIELIKDNSIAQTRTDFLGKAQFDEIKPRNYFLICCSRLGGDSVWYLPIEVKSGKNNIYLDNKNMAVCDRSLSAY